MKDDHIGFSRLCSGVLFTLLCFVSFSKAAIILPAVISDHMVLARSETTAVWGRATPGETLTITLGDNSAAATVDNAGNWRAVLDLSEADAGPQPLIITSSCGFRKTVHDVLVGSVWLAAGQSNMQMILSQTHKGREAVVRAGDAHLRHFKVALHASREPVTDCEGTWVIADPSTVAEFTAVGYYFAKRLRAETGAPVGLINACWGGTHIESWTSREALNTIPDIRKAVAAQDHAIATYPEQLQDYRDRFAEWMKASGRSDPDVNTPDTMTDSGYDADAWNILSIPGRVSDAGFSRTGVFHFRKNIPDRLEITRSHMLFIGELAGFETVYWNGHKIGETRPETLPGRLFLRRYMITPDMIRDGGNALVIRLFSPHVEAGLEHPNIRVGPVHLRGEWDVKQDKGFADLSADQMVRIPVPPAAPRSPQGTAAALFNGMIYPVHPFRISGVIWYQGEGNVTRARQYGEVFPVMINDWRRLWNDPDLPFLFCQLPNYTAKTTVPGDHNWAELREAQSRALHLPRTGQAVLIDLGEAEAVHPARKQEVGDRLARIALAIVYGKAIPHTGPVFKSASVEGKRLRLRFFPLEGGLRAAPVPETHELFIGQKPPAPLVRNTPESELEGFAICGPDRKWVWAQARIEEDSVLVWSEAVPEPVAVRYAWAGNPTGNLTCAAGLPASPFRTDDFTGISNRMYQ